MRLDRDTLRLALITIVVLMGIAVVFVWWVVQMNSMQPTIGRPA